MSKDVEINIDDLIEFRDELKKLVDVELKEFFEAVAKELAARFLALVVPATPTGIYPNGSGKVGGTLKRGWTAGEEKNAYAFAKSIDIKNTGDKYSIVISNPVEYASYVEYGHRTVTASRLDLTKEEAQDKKMWVRGKFMMTRTELILNQKSPEVIERYLTEFLMYIFG
ncbi:HK97 gp10 family phage protein [Methanolapillus millepedarum]|uniref:HK97 gp10 family phage protein n=1 Tax=Methanolapillus millepedarum TaxID=3028296 RepID=A0AA96V6R6_9EURY|nr:hypothetical protein MsAc7_17660 [Methanosarcinaceae archaeon Ac7]